MEQVVLFVLRLAMYPMLLIGAVLCLAALYNWLRTCSCIKVSTPCRAHLITGAVLLVAIWLMAPGVPSTLTSVSDWGALVCYGACAFAGGRWVWQKRDQLLDWVKTTFELN